MKRIAAFLLVLFSAIFADAQTTVFTYQGKLNDGATPANGTYQMQFELYDAQAAGAGTQIGESILVNVSVVNGIFTTQLDFGQSPFTQGQDLFLQISVRRTEVEPLSLLEPRQPLTSAPYAIKARIAETAVTSVNSQQLGGVAANQYVLTNDSRMTDARTPLPGSNDYIQNGTVSQPAANFNIAGEGKANIFSALTQYNLGASRVLSAPGTDNIFVGSDSGTDNSGGVRNSFTGFGAGRFNTTGSNNSFFGNRAGRDNATGELNSFFGSESGLGNTTGASNSFFGFRAGALNTIGSNNTFLGAFANAAANNLTNATAVGANALVAQSNSLVLGSNANVGIGTSTPEARLQVSGGGVLLDNNQGFFFKDTNNANKRVLLADPNNILRMGSGGALGFNEMRFDLATPGSVMTLNSAGNVGIGTTVPASRLTVSGLIETTSGGVKFPDGTIQTTAFTNGGNFIVNSTALQPASNFNIAGEGKANIFNAATQFNLNGNRILSNAGSVNLFVGVDAGASNTGSANTFVGAAAGQDNTTGSENSFFGRGAGTNNTIGFGNSFFGRSAGLGNTTGEQNSFFGQESGFTNQTGQFNAFFGALSGRANSNGSSNSFFGFSAGFSNTGGGSNSFFGMEAGRNTDVGANNSFFGRSAGFSNRGGSDNTFLGQSAGLSNTTGSGNTYIGRSAGGGGNGSQNVFVGMNSGNNNAGGANTFLGYGAGVLNVGGNSNTFLGYSAGAANQEGNFNVFIGRESGPSNTTGSSNIFIGRQAGVTNTIGSNNTVLGANADVGLGVFFGTAIGAGARVTASDTIVLGRSNGADRVVVYGRLELESLSPGASIPLCLETVTRAIGSCSSGSQEKQEPALKNQVEAQKAQIDEQQKQLDEQKKQIKLLTELVCSQNKTAAVCQ